MKITPSMMNKELRLTGTLIRSFINFKNRSSFEKAQLLVNKTLIGRKSKQIHCEERYITKKDGEKLRICIYKALDSKKDSVGVLWLHGGGYAIGAPEQDIGYAKDLIRTANCVIVAPDYRLSLDAPYPAALEDSYEALLWLKENANVLGISEKQIFVGGISSGGGLTAAISLYARDKGEVSIAFQLPLYPMLDDRMITESSKDNDAPIWNTKTNTIAWKMYLDQLYGTENVPVYAAPARATDFSSLPPTYTFVSDIDPFYDETKEYILNLRKAGVKADLTVYKGCFHAFDIICSYTKIARHARKKLFKKFLYATKHYYAKQPE